MTGVGCDEALVCVTSRNCCHRGDRVMCERAGWPRAVQRSVRDDVERTSGHRARAVSPGPRRPSCGIGKLDHRRRVAFVWLRCATAAPANARRIWERIRHRFCRVVLDLGRTTDLHRMGGTATRRRDACSRRDRSSHGHTVRTSDDSVTVSPRSDAGSCCDRNPKPHSIVVGLVADRAPTEAQQRRGLPPTLTSHD